MSDNLEVLFEGEYLSLVTRDGWEFASRLQGDLVAGRSRGRRRGV